MLLKYLLIVLFISYCLAQNNKVNKDKKCSLKKLDKKSTPIMGSFGNEKINWPKNEKESERYCKAMNSGGKFMKTFGKKCLNGLSKTLLSTFLKNIEKVNKNFCGSKAKSKKDFISWASCGNGAKNETTKCWDNLIDNLSSVKVVKEAKNKIPLSCCYFYNWKSCTLKAYRDIGQTVCPNSAITGYEAIIDGQVVNTLKVLCGDYNDKSNKCINLQQDFPQKLQSDGYKRPKTLFIPVLQVFDTL